jgi:type II secretory pathway component PulK
MMRRSASWSRGTRRGVALLTALMSLVLIAALAAASRTSTGSGLRALERDIAGTKARWQVEGCAEVGLATLNGLQEALGGDAWTSLDSAFARSRATDFVRGCDLRLFAVGRVLGVGQYDSPAFARLLTAAGVTVQRAESLSAALMDWTDDDDLAREGGAESAWYRDAHRPTPRNGALRSLDELGLVRGFGERGFLADTVLRIVGMAPARISIRHASIPVFRSLEGVSEADAEAMFRTRVIPPWLLRLPTNPGVDGRSAISVSDVPDGWELSARVLDADGRTIAERRMRLGRTQTRIAVLDVEESR